MVLMLLLNKAGNRYTEDFQINLKNCFDVDFNSTIENLTSDI